MDERECKKVRNSWTGGREAISPDEESKNQHAKLQLAKARSTNVERIGNSSTHHDADVQRNYVDNTYFGLFADNVCASANDDPSNNNSNRIGDKNDGPRSGIAGICAANEHFHDRCGGNDDTNTHNKPARRPVQRSRNMYRATFVERSRPNTLFPAGHGRR